MFMAALSPGDLGLICCSLYPAVGPELVDKMVAFNCRLEQELVARREWGQQGAPWEFNLRDLLRCKALVGGGGALQLGRYVGLVYGARLRRREDRARLEAAYREVFGPDDPLQEVEVSLHCSPDYVSIGQHRLERGAGGRSLQGGLQLLPGQAESLAGCVRYRWPVVLTGASGSGKSALVSLLA